MNKYNSKTFPAFTIVELLIVIVVIGILAAITIVAYNGVQSRAHDAKRKSDLKELERYAQLYIADNGISPKSTVGCYAARSYLNNGECEDFSNFQDINKYMNSKIPKDPTNNSTYFYMYYKAHKVNSTGDGVINGTDADFVITARLEDSSKTLFNFNGSQFNYVVGTK